MTKIIMYGCNGAMGKVITSLAAEQEDVEIVAGIDLQAGSAGAYPVSYTHLRAHETSV